MSEMHSPATSASSSLPQEREHLLHHLLSGVEQIAPIITAHRAASEQARTLAPEVVQAMRDVGLLTMKSPCEIGGGEIHPVDQMEVIEAVVKLDSAAAWSMFIAATVSGRALSALSDEAVAEAFADGDIPIMAGSLKPAGSATPVDGGYRITGQWAWGSGVHHADYVIVPVLKADTRGLITAVVPRANVRVIDNWYSLGINGSGSSDYALDDVFVPASFVNESQQQRRGGAVYRMGYGFAANEHAIFAYALARLALDTVVQSAQAKKRGYGAGTSIADREIFQRAVAEGELRLRATKLLMVDTLERLYAASAEAEAPVALQAEARAASVLCTDEAIAVTSQLFRYAGGSAVMLDDPLQRILRDLYTAQSHLMVSDSAYESLGKLRLGLTDKAPLR
jgi:alkylation response protein AidB-like acyl-CoA dehydrogenase